MCHSLHLTHNKVGFYLNERVEKSPLIPGRARRLGFGILNLGNHRGCSDEAGRGTTTQQEARSRKGQGCSGCRGADTWP